MYSTILDENCALIHYRQTCKNSTTMYNKLSDKTEAHLTDKKKTTEI